MKSVRNRIRDHEEEIIYDALKECAPSYVAQGAAMVMYSMEICGISNNDILRVYDEFLQILKRKDVMGKQPTCIGMMRHLKSKYDIDISDIEVNYPEFKSFVKEWRK